MARVLLKQNQSRCNYNRHMEELYIDNGMLNILRTDIQHVKAKYHGMRIDLLKKFSLRMSLYTKALLIKKRHHPHLG